MNGRTLKPKLVQLMRQHRIVPEARAPLPLLPATSCAQIISGVAASSDVDVERMSFFPGSLSWPTDLDRIPLLLRHSDKLAGKLISVDYRPDGRLLVCAQVDDQLATRMPAFSIAATVAEAEVRDEASACFHLVIRRATLDHIALTDSPANATALVLTRRDFSAVDASNEALTAATLRARKVIEEMLSKTSSSDAAPAKAKQASYFARDIPASSAMILGPVPVALLRRPSTSFGDLVARMSAMGGE